MGGVPKELSASGGDAGRADIHLHKGLKWWKI